MVGVNTSLPTTQRMTETRTSLKNDTKLLVHSRREIRLLPVLARSRRRAISKRSARSAGTGNISVLAADIDAGSAATGSPLSNAIRVSNLASILPVAAWIWLSSVLHKGQLIGFCLFTSRRQKPTILTAVEPAVSGARSAQIQPRCLLTDAYFDVMKRNLFRQADNLYLNIQVPSYVGYEACTVTDKLGSFLQELVAIFQRSLVIPENALQCFVASAAERRLLAWKLTMGIVDGISKSDEILI